MYLCTPGDSVNIPFDWSAEALPEEITIASVAHSVEAPLSIVSESYTTTESVVRVTGSVHGRDLYVTGTATLSNGETLVRRYPVRGFYN